MPKPTLMYQKSTFFNDKRIYLQPELQHNMANRTRDEVFGTTELLEHILLRLDVATLLTSAQRVHRRWLDVIRDSPTLQRRLFFRGLPEPERGYAAAVLDDPSSSGPEVNPFLREKFNMFFHEPPAKTDPEGLEDLWKTMHPYHIRYDNFLDDLLSQTRTVNFKSFFAGPGTRFWGQGLPTKRLALAESEARRAAFFRSGASWRRMLVAQPPPRRLGFMQQKGTQTGCLSAETHRWSELRLDDDGLRMGDLYDMAAGWTGRHHLFGVIWKPVPVPIPPHESTIGYWYDPWRDVRVPWEDQVPERESLAAPPRVDLVFRLERAVVNMPKWDEKRPKQMRRARDKFRQVFCHPDASEKPLLFETQSLRWSRLDNYGHEVAEGDSGYL